MSHLHTTLRQYIADQFLGGSPPVDFDDNYDLVDSGILDSLAMISLITYLENEYQIEFDDQDFLPENFKSVNAVHEFLCRKRQSAA